MQTLAELTGLVEERQGGLYVRWSKGPDIDLGEVSSTDELTGVPMPGLSANPLDVEDWWQGRPGPPVGGPAAVRLRPPAAAEGPSIRPWILEGRRTAGAPTTSPSWKTCGPCAISPTEVIDEARAEVARQEHEWGPLRRGARG
ncbi:putative protein OS=Streptomyces glaucescens OX=1907 GN=SGLAU_02615 PE=4 SV=1 [Streptomyces glaucescens]